jgi:hypothetical protein
MPVSSTRNVKVNGEDIELFYISTLAEALGRTPQTIRKWEVAGILPDCLFRDKLGRRMYSADQIKAIVEIAEKSHVRQGYSVANTNFSPRVFEALAELNKKYIPKEEK